MNSKAEPPVHVASATAQISERMLLVYSLLRSKTSEASLYSVGVTLYDRDGQNDAALVTDVTGNDEEAAALFQKLVDGTVTPCTLTDVLEDLL